jgi:DNA-binding NtrC family response regulator
MVRQCVGDQYKVFSAASREECLNQFKKKRHEFAFVDIAFLMGENGRSSSPEFYKESLSDFRQICPTTEMIIIASQETIRDAMYAVKAGASNYITSPVNCDEVNYVLERIREAVRTKLELNYLRDQFWDKKYIDFIQTRSPLMKAVFEKVRSVAPTHTTVMLYGETGTGKGVIARLIHAHSNRKMNQFIGVHCGAIPETLIESELFGHEKGAFTGAEKRKRGKFEIAQEGTIFLDEIGTISPSTQIKLLQVLQDRVFQPIDSEETIESRARFVAASNIDLKESADSGSFRKDLYYRLNVFPIEIPPLKQRTEDIPLLVDSFLTRLNKLYNKEIRGLHPLVMETFEKYTWPGNIRELENIIERAHILEEGQYITPESIPGELFIENPVVSHIRVPTSKSLHEVRSMAIENVERQYLKELLAQNHGRIDKSSRDAGISTRQIHKLLTKYGIKKEDYKINRNPKFIFSRTTGSVLWQEQNQWEYRSDMLPVRVFQPYPIP